MNDISIFINLYKHCFFNLESRKMNKELVEAFDFLSSQAKGISDSQYYDFESTLYKRILHMHNRFIFGFKDIGIFFYSIIARIHSGLCRKKSTGGYPWSSSELGSLYQMESTISSVIDIRYYRKLRL